MSILDNCTECKESGFSEFYWMSSSENSGHARQGTSINDFQHFSAILNPPTYFVPQFLHIIFALQRPILAVI